MNKKPLFREKSKPNSRERNRKANEDIDNTEKGNRTLKEKSSYSNNIVQQFSKSKKHMQTSQLKKATYKDKFICEDCAMLHKHTTVKDGDVGHNQLLDKKKLDSDYIDSLVCKIKELKNRVKFFENQYGFETIVHNSVVCHYQSENEAIGDYDISKQHHKRSKNKLGIQFSNDDTQLCGDIDKTFHPQFYKRAKSFSDRQRSIYTNNDAIIAPSLVQDGYKRISKNHKNKSTASIVMSLNSTNHNDFVKINPHMSSKHFQAAAEEFIEQAEELKSKIGYILECCGYTTPTISNFSESGMASELNYNTLNNTSNNTHSNDSMNDASSDPHLKVLFETVSSQYKEILDSLMSIESQIRTLHKHKPHPKIPEVQEEPIVIKKMPDRKHRSAILPNRMASPTPPSTSFTIDAKKYLSDLEPKHFKMGISNKVLEPVVMVYEPIHPESSEGEMFKSSFKDKRDDTKQKYGFVVTYTPDISPESSINVSDGKSGKKNNKKQVKKKRLLPCLGF